MWIHMRARNKYILWHSGLVHLSYLQHVVADLTRILASCVFHICKILCHAELCYLAHPDLTYFPYLQDLVIDLTH